MTDRPLTYDDGYREGLAARPARPQRVDRCRRQEIEERVRRLNRFGYDVVSVVVPVHGDNGPYLLISTSRTP